MFEPGETVMCIDGRFPEGIEELYDVLPCEGHVYTVRDIQPGIELGTNEPTVSVLLEGLENPAGPSGYERGFAPWRFANEEALEEAAQDEEFWNMLEEAMSQNPSLN